MRVSELSKASGVSIPLIKYYLREGMLQPGIVTSRTTATYDDTHVARLKLIRALIEFGGLAVAEVRRIIEVIDNPPDHDLDIIRAAARSIPTPAPGGEASDEVRELMRELGWHGLENHRNLGSLTTALAAARSAGISIPTRGVKAYAELAYQQAEIDLWALTHEGAEESSGTPGMADLVELVVVGTVMMDPVLCTLRRLAQAAVSTQMMGTAPPD